MVKYFCSIALPSLLCFNIDRLHRKALQCEIETQQSMIETLRKEIQTGDAEISSLRDQVLVALKELLVSYIISSSRANSHWIFCISLKLGRPKESDRST